MTSKQFFKYLVEPEQLNDGSVVELEQLIKQFPFFQTAHLLYLKALNRINPKLVTEKLPKESLFVSDRTVLHSLLHPVANTPEDKTAAPKKETIVSAPAPKTEDKKVVEDKKPEDKKLEDKKVEDKNTVETKVEVKKPAETKAEDKKVEVATTKTTTTVTETTTEKKAPVIETKEIKGSKRALTNEERKQNHDNLVKDFFDLKDKEKYETVATNVADDGTIKSAAAELAAKSQIDRGTVINEKTSAPQQTTTTTTVVTTVVEKTTKPAEEQPATSENPENQDAILNKIAALRKEREEANKKRIIAEEEAKKTKAAAEEEAKRVAEAEAKAAKAEAEAKAAAKAKAEAEAAKAKAEAEAEAAAKAKAEAEAAAKAKAEAEAAAKQAAEEAVKTTVTTTTVTETVITTVETKDETPAPEPEKPAEETKEMSAADKLLARLNKYKATEPAPEQKSGENLIDKFLKEDHHLDRNMEVQEGDMGQDSVKQPELYSEKLAKLYIQQGHYDKAIASYEKLNTKYPDKADYFAAQIEEIKKLMNNK